MSSPLATWPDTSWQPRAVVFDCDGLLADTEAEWVAAQDEYLASHGASFTPATRREVTGRSVEHVISAIAREIDRSALTVAAEVTDLIRSAPARAVRAMPGAIATVREVAALVPVAVASNSPREMLESTIAGLGLGDAFDATVAVEDVAQPKPAPDLYALAASRLGADAPDAVAFEDSETGAQSASAAGLRVIGVPSVPGQEPRADILIASLEDPDLHHWISRWEMRR